MPASRAALLASAVAAVLFGAGPAAAKDCVAACTLFENANQKYLVHEAKVQCKKHNVSPRPTTEDICLSTFRALTHSACAVHCDPTGHEHVADACGAIAGTTWVPKHNAFRSCKTGYKAAQQHVPRLVAEAADRMPALRDLLEAEDAPKYKATKSQEFKFDRKKAETPKVPEASATAAAAADAASAAEAAAAAAAGAADAAAALAAAKGATAADQAAAAAAAKEAEAAATAAAQAEARLLETEAAAELSAEEQAELADEFVFPVTIDDGSVVDLVLTATDNVVAKVAAFCAKHMAEEDGCADQLLPIVQERMAEDQPAR